VTSEAGATTGHDAIGVAHRRHADRATLRIVSLVPSLTELLCDLGLADAIVGRTGFCIHPAATVARIPKVGGTKDVNVAKIRALAPTHVVVNVDENEKPTVDAIAAFVPDVIVTHPAVPQDNLALYRLFGHVFDRTDAAEALCARFEAAWQRLMAARGAWPPQRVLYLIWKDPWMTIAADTYIARVLATIGWQQVEVDDARDATVASSPRYPAVDLARAARAADRVLLSTEPYRFTATHVAALRDAGMPAQLVDGELLSWYGSRAIAGLGYLAELAAT
jgi:ABC-type Fe3+-hydroxamate transport system substrate-binding protein